MKRFIAVLALALPFSLIAIASATATVFSLLESCGTVSDKHLCATVTQADHNKTLTIASKDFANAVAGPSLATWSGTVVCKVNAKAIRPDHFEANVQVHLQLYGSAGAENGIEIGGLGQASTGFLVTQPVNFIHGESWPLMLSRVTLGSLRGLVVRARPQFNAGTGSCTVHGGVFTLVK